VRRDNHDRREQSARNIKLALLHVLLVAIIYVAFFVLNA
jgi:hypothetical protein